MSAQEFLDSGNLEAYCIGVLTAAEQAEVLLMCSLFPEVKNELAQIELSMESLASSLSVVPVRNLKSDILSKLGFSATQLDLSNLPMIDENTDYEHWLSALVNLIPENPAEDMVFQPLTRTPELEQSLVFTRMCIPEETHGNLIESFFILKGTCTCMVGANAYNLGSGDFLEIPLYTEHDIQLTSPSVLAILQQRPLLV